MSHTSVLEMISSPRIGQLLDSSLYAFDWSIHTVGMKHSTEALVEFVKLVKLSGTSRVPKYSV